MIARRIALALLATLAACTNFGPTENKGQLDAEVAKVSLDEGGALLSGIAYWMPNSAGMPSFGAQVAAPEQVREGTLVVTKDSVRFFVWDRANSRFLLARRIAVAQIEEAIFSRRGLGTRITVRSKVEPIFDSFAFVHESQQVIDGTKNEQAAQLINEIIRPK